MTQKEAIVKQTIALNNIKAFCTMRGIKLGELEQSIGLSKGYLSRIKVDGRGVPFFRIIMIADELGVSLERLVDPYVVSNMESLESQKAELLKKRDALSAKPV